MRRKNIRLIVTKQLKYNYPPWKKWAKISASLVDEYCFLDRLDWNNYNESVDLKHQIEACQEKLET